VAERVPKLRVPWVRPAVSEGLADAGGWGEEKPRAVFPRVGIHEERLQCLPHSARPLTVQGKGSFSDIPALTFLWKIL